MVVVSSLLSPNRLDGGDGEADDGDDDGDDDADSVGATAWCTASAETVSTIVLGRATDALVGGKGRRQASPSSVIAAAAALVPE